MSSKGTPQTYTEHKLDEISVELARIADALVALANAKVSQ